MAQIYTLQFQVEPAEELDWKFALLADQDYNYGNTNDWFGYFRGGLYGFYARLKGCMLHYDALHVWLPQPQSPTYTESHLASFFFNADSALECLTFAINALGNCIDPAAFVDVSNDDSLRKINPENIIGAPTKKPPLPGYAKYFPTFQDHWVKNHSLIETIMDHHDVSKHRQTIYRGGRLRLDPPPGYPADFGPHAEIILQGDPRVHHSRQPTASASGHTLLEQLAPDYCDFINTAVKLALADARTNIPLKVQQFRA